MNTEENTTGTVGVRWDKRDQKWQAYLTVEGKRHHIGYYTSKATAARNRNRYILQHDLPHQLNDESLQSGDAQMTNEAKRYNIGKRDFTQLPSGYIRQAARAMMHGAEKYGRDNWRNALESPEAAEVWIQTCKECMMRHTVAYALDGNQCDSESGVHHLGHMVANAAMILACESYLGRYDDE